MSAVRVKLHRLVRAGSRSNIEIELWKDEESGKFHVTITGAEWSSSGLTARSLKWVEGKLEGLRERILSHAARNAEGWGVGLGRHRGRLRLHYFKGAGPLCGAPLICHVLDRMKVLPTVTRHPTCKTCRLLYSNLKRKKD